MAKKVIKFKAKNISIESSNTGNYISILPKKLSVGRQVCLERSVNLCTRGVS